MATASQALSQLAGTVSKTASTLTNIVGTIDGSVSIVNNYVQRHLADQETKNAVYLAFSKDRLEKDAALEATERDIEIAQRLKDPEFAATYQSHLTEIRKITRPTTSAA